MLIQPLLTAYLEQNTTDCLAAIRAAEQQMLSYYLQYEYQSVSSYGEVVAGLCSSLQYVSQHNPTLAGLLQARRAQLLSFNKVIAYSGKMQTQWERIETKLNNLLPYLLDGVLELNTLGQVLFYVRHTFRSDEEELNSDIELVKVPQQYYCRTAEGGFHLLPNTLWGRTHADIAPQNYIYMQDENILPGGLMLALIKYILAKDSNLNSWYEGNNRLFGALVAFYDIDKLIDSVKTSSPEAMEDEINANVKQGLAEIAQQLSDSRRFGSAIMPDAVTLQKQDFVNYNIGESFRQFVEKIDAICEIAILGQAGTTRDTPNGSFAKAKAMQVTTDNIRDADIQTTRALAAKAMQVILPLMTGAIKSEEVALEFIYDDNVDVLSFVNAIRSMNDMNIKTDRGNLFKIDVAELYRKLDITLNEAFYAKDEVFELGDKFEQELANELQPSAVAVGDEFKVK